jgi:hypothetical protein
MKNRNAISELARMMAVLLASLTLALAASAQTVPPLINYQGKLTDQNGNPLPAGNYGIQFRIWDSGTAAGTNDLIWAQQQNATIQINGVFNVILGSPGGSPIAGVTPAVNNLAYAFNGSNCFLGVTIVVSNGVSLGSPSEILPRQQLLSVPFALMSGAVIPGAIGSQQIAQGGIQNANLAAGSITLTNLAPRQIGSNVGVGGVAMSQYVSTNTPASGVEYTVPGLTVTLVTTGRPVMVVLNGSTNGAAVNVSQSSTTVGSDPAGFVYFSRNGSKVATLFLGIATGKYYDGGFSLTIPATAYQFLDIPPAGTNTYSVSFKGADPFGTSTMNLSGQLVAFEF